MSIPAPNNANNVGGAPFLKTMHLAKKGLTQLTLLGKAHVQDGQYGQQILVPCKIGKKEYTFAVKVDSGNHSRLFARFGANENKWKGAIKVQVASHMGRDYVQVAD
jgi:hypothetical protein